MWYHTSIYVITSVACKNTNTILIKDLKTLAMVYLSLFMVIYTMDIKSDAVFSSFLYLDQYSSAHSTSVFMTNVKLETMAAIWPLSWSREIVMFFSIFQIKWQMISLKKRELIF